MTKVSKIKMNPKIEKRIYEILFKSVLKLKDQGEVVEFLTDLLTPTEQSMVAKRLSIAVLLAKGYTYESIMNILRVSKSAINSVSNVLVRSGKGYQKVISRLIKEEKIRKLFLDIEELFDLIPPKGGSWSEWRKRRWQRGMDKQKPL